jgi:hypothetical protein
VQPANHAIRRTGLRVLHERSGEPRFAEIVVENVCVEGPGEQATIITERLRNEDENVREGSPFNAHLEMLA